MRLREEVVGPGVDLRPVRDGGLAVAPDLGQVQLQERIHHVPLGRLDPLRPGMAQRGDELLGGDLAAHVPRRLVRAEVGAVAEGQHGVPADRVANLGVGAGHRPEVPEALRAVRGAGEHVQDRPFRQP